MPTTHRGRVIRYRTVKLPHHKGYVHIEVVSKAGPHGGHTVAGPVHKYKHHSSGKTVHVHVHVHSHRRRAKPTKRYGWSVWDRSKWK